MAGLPAQQKNDLYLIGYRYVALIMFGVCLASTLLAYPVLSIWLNPDFAKQSLLIVMILAFGIWLNSMAQVPFTFLHANADTKLTAILHIIELVIYLFALYYLVYLFGLVGAALAWTLRVGIDLMLLQWAVKKSDLIERVN
jgi:O-antigen/teichoic acid export membrane protein